MRDAERPSDDLPVLRQRCRVQGRSDGVFGCIAWRYDVLCDPFSLLIHAHGSSAWRGACWRDMLDAAAGTGNIALRVARRLASGDPAIAYVATGGDQATYAYLLRGIRDFPGAAAFSEEIAAHGFVDARYRRHSLGIVALHEARRMPPLP